MKIKRFAVLLVVCALPALAFAGPVKPGKWQMTIQTEMAGSPMKMPPITTTSCLTKEDAENPERFVPQQRKGSDCKYTDVKVDGSSVSWKMSCEKSQMTGSGHMTYTSDSATGAMHMTMPQGEINAKYSAKYLGDCDK